LLLVVVVRQYRMSKIYDVQENGGCAAPGLPSRPEIAIHRLRRVSARGKSQDSGADNTGFEPPFFEVFLEKFLGLPALRKSLKPDEGCDDLHVHGFQLGPEGAADREGGGVGQTGLFVPLAEEPDFLFGGGLLLDFKKGSGFLWRETEAAALFDQHGQITGSLFGIRPVLACGEAAPRDALGDGQALGKHFAEPEEIRGGHKSLGWPRGGRIGLRACTA